MIKSEMIKQYGPSMTEEIIKAMMGCTLGLTDDGEIDYYQIDIDRILYRIKNKGI